jgi:DNA-binding SARP family transcriptional activator
MQQHYRDNLKRANDYIRDAQEAVNLNPNDEEARRSLMEAYQQKSMLFEMAMDRSLP